MEDEESQAEAESGEHSDLEDDEVQAAENYNFSSSSEQEEMDD